MWQSVIVGIVDRRRGSSSRRKDVAMKGGVIQDRIEHSSLPSFDLTWCRDPNWCYNSYKANRHVTGYSESEVERLCLP